MKKGIRIVSIAIGIYLAFRFLLPMVIPFVIAGIVSVLYYPLLRNIYRNSEIWEGRKKKWILILSVVLFYVVLFVLLSVLLVYVFGQCESIWLNFPFYQARILAIVKSCCCNVDVFLHMGNGSCYAYMEQMFGSAVNNDLSGMLPKVTIYSVQVAEKLFGFVFEVIVTVLATFFLIQDYERFREKMLESFWGQRVCKMIAKCKDTLKTYIKAQGFIMGMDAIICTLAFLVIGQPYYLVLGPLVAFLDALPVLGAGIILIPYGLYLLIVKEFGKALVIVLAYLGCVIVRQLTEPRMIGNKIGIRPVFTLFSMYVGCQLFGVIGFLLGPVGVLLGMEIYHFIEEK